MSSVTPPFEHSPHFLWFQTSGQFTTSSRLIRPLDNCSILAAIFKEGFLIFLRYLCIVCGETPRLNAAAWVPPIRLQNLTIAWFRLFMPRKYHKKCLHPTVRDGTYCDGSRVK